MFAAIRAFFSVFVTLFTAVEKNAQSILILSEIGNTMATGYAASAASDAEIQGIKDKAKRVKALAKAKAEALAIEASE